MAEERLEEIRAHRLAKREALIAQGKNPYPAEARRSHTLHELSEKFDQLSNKEEPVTVAGRVFAIRRHGSVVFLDVRDQSATLQLQLTKDSMPEDFFVSLDLLDVGDFIEAAGKLGRTTRGVPTLMVAQWHILTKSIRPLPSSWYGLKDHEQRFRHRELDLLLDQERRQPLLVRSQIMAWLRQYLLTQGYLEIETPVLQPVSGGAAAQPFVTHHQALDMPLYLRISAELYLKRLLAAGFEKVFEIGQRFRNEGIDRQHNPEFTMLESQWAYADYEDLMTFTEEVLELLLTQLLGTQELTWQGEILSFAKPLKRVRYVEAVSQAINLDILTEKNPGAYIELCQERGIELPQAKTYAKLIDELYKNLVRPNLRQPTLLYDYPIELAPLAKPSLHDPRVAEKFQLVAVGLELNNCYTELNDPVAQRRAFEQQQAARAAGDVEAQMIDEAYLQAMEYGMPPNAGWSLGIDRLTMLIADVPSIRDTLAFPLMRPQQ